MSFVVVVVVMSVVDMRVGGAYSEIACDGANYDERDGLGLRCTVRC